MPINEALVREIHQHIRSKFKHTAKAYNKSYLDVDSTFFSGAPQLPSPERKHVAQLLEDKKLGAHSIQELRRKGFNIPGSTSMEKRLIRMRNRTKSESLIETIRCSQPSDDYVYGEAVFRNPVAGNCHEMSAAAAWYAIQRNAGQVYLGLIDEPGDHVFCLVCSGEAPQWPTVASTHKDRNDAWVIDGWANICCPLWQYEMLFIMKMVQWRLAGKRIMFNWIPQGKTMEHVGWIAPDSREYLNAFKYSELDFERVSKPSGGRRERK